MTREVDFLSYWPLANRGYNVRNFVLGLAAKHVRLFEDSIAIGVAATGG